jgi:deltex-like protein
MSSPVTVVVPIVVNPSVIFQWWDDISWRWVNYTPFQQQQFHIHLTNAGVDDIRLQSLDFSNIPPYTLHIPGHGTYTIDFQKLEQINQTTDFVRKMHAFTQNIQDGKEPTDENNDMNNVNETNHDEEKNNIFTDIDPFTLTPTDQCVLCLETFTQQDKVVIPVNCNGHYFHKKCPSLDLSIKEYIQETKQCPVCKRRYGTVIGNMPNGYMHVNVLDMSLPGFEQFKTIQITFDFPGGVQTDEHPNPGRYYAAEYRNAYLPDTPEGRNVLVLIQKAWDQKILFTIGTSITRGLDDCIIYNGIHFKTVPFATSTEPWGWPDSTYLYRIVQELNDKGIYYSR